MSSVTNPEIRERFAELHPALTPSAALAEANRCLYCFDAPCTAACPTHIDVPRFIKKIASANLKGSALTILDANILGASCARVCPVEVLCEGACVLNLSQHRPIEIARLQRHAMDDFHASGYKLPGFGAVPKPQRVACIGAGPASLACAAELRRIGIQVTIFDSRTLAGGLNTYGVAEYKLRAEESLREIALVQSLGVEFRLGVEIGREVTLKQLESEYDFIFLGAGLGKIEPLRIPGEDLEGVVDALRLIADYKTAQSIPIGRRVAVIGAGNTAIDAANAARRLGAEEVFIVYRRDEAEMPAFSFEYDHAKQEGVKFVWLLQPLEIKPDQEGGRVGALHCVSMALGAPDERGRRKPEPLPDSTVTLLCDMVVLAIGQSRQTRLLNECSGVTLREGLVEVDRKTGRTANPKYYAGGDCVNGGREVVDAVADGKRAAKGMIESLEAQHG